MYDMIELYKKEMNVDLKKITNYFESAKAVYEATVDIYADDTDMVFEAGSTFKEKVKKTFTAIIEAIKSFFKKCRDAIHEKIIDSRVKKAFADVTKYAKSSYKDLEKRGDISPKKYKETLKMLNDVPKAYAKVYVMCEKITKDVINSSDYDKALRYYEEGCERVSDFVDSLEENVSADTEAMLSNPEVFTYANTSDIAMLNANMGRMENDCIEHLEHLHDAALEKLVDEMLESVEENANSNTQKVTLIQKLANFVSSITRKISSIITSFTLKIMSGVVTISGKLAAKKEAKE